MKEKRLLQRLGEAVVSASSHKGMAHAHTGTRVHRVQPPGRGCEYQRMHAQSQASTGQPTGGKTWFSGHQCNFYCLCEHSPAHTKPHAYCRATILENQTNLKQTLQTNGCSGMYGDAESQAYQNHDLLQKYPRVLT